MADTHDVILLGIGLVLFGVGVLIGLNIISAINNKSLAQPSSSYVQIPVSLGAK
jgi:Na+-transporting NADH:ubiquinone oxidoreductase subunit NqrD